MRARGCGHGIMGKRVGVSTKIQGFIADESQSMKHLALGDELWCKLLLFPVLAPVTVPYIIPCTIPS